MGLVPAKKKLQSRKFSRAKTFAHNLETLPSILSPYLLLLAKPPISKGCSFTRPWHIFSQNQGNILASTSENFPQTNENNNQLLWHTIRKKITIINQTQVLLSTVKNVTFYSKKCQNQPITIAINYPTTYDN